jgi:hypothetical protein
MKIFAAATALLAATCALPVAAQSLAEARTAYLAAWEAAPLVVRKSLFVTSQAESFGLYEVRPSNVFAVDEPIHVYLEPEGYGWKDEAGINRFGVKVGLRVLNPDAQELFAKADFLDLTATSAERPTDFYGTFTLNLTGLSAGSYVLELILTDAASDETATVAMPIEVR